MIAGLAVISFLAYFAFAFLAAWLFQRSWQTRLLAGALFPVVLFLLCCVLDIVRPMSGEGFLRFNWRSLWVLPGAFLGRDLFVSREPLYSEEPGTDWKHPLPDGRVLASWRLPRSDRRAIGWVEGSTRRELFQYNHETLGAWGSEFRDGAPDGRGGFFVVGLFLMTGQDGISFPMLHFNSAGELDRKFPYRTRLGMEAAERVTVAEDGSVWLRLNTAPKPTFEHWSANWIFDAVYDLSNPAVPNELR